MLSGVDLELTAFSTAKLQKGATLPTSLYKESAITGEPACPRAHRVREIPVIAPVPENSRDHESGWFASSWTNIS